MIDEELYKQATDELNSSDRKPDIWARACALAADDHDEARYLYTNLRVEQLLEEKARATTGAGVPPGAGTDAHATEVPTSHDNLARLELESLDTTLSDDSHVSSSRPGIDHGDSSSAIAIDDIIDLGEEDAQRPESVVGTSVLLDEESAKFDLDPDEVLNMNLAHDAEQRARVHEQTEREAPQLPVQDAPGTAIDSVAEAINVPAPEEIRTRGLANELERQAREIDAIDGNVETADEYDDPDNVSIVVTGAAAAAGGAGTATIRADYADGDIAAELEKSGDFADLDNGYGRVYMVFGRDGSAKAVKKGLSWPALFFTFPWLICKGLVGTAIVYVLMTAIILGGLMIAGFAWMDAGPAANTVTKMWTLGFGALALIGLLYLPLRHGNSWVARKLLNRGYEFRARVSARNKKDAIDRLMRFAG